MAAKKKDGTPASTKGRKSKKITLKDLKPKKDPRGGAMSTRIGLRRPNSITST